jgi:hypothetical protein
VNKSELQNLSQKSAAKRDRRIALANSEYEADLAHIAGVLKLLDEDEPENPVSVVQPPTETAVDVIAKSPTYRVREAIQSFEDSQFLMRDTLNWISAKHPDRGILPDQVSTAINRLVATGEVEIVKKGGGRGNPTIYKATKKLRRVLTAEAIASLDGVRIV